MKDYKYAVFIGRFQPLHNAHVEVIEYGLKIAEKVIVIVGSQSAAPNTKNPFSFEEREDMLHEAIAPSKVRGFTTEYHPNHGRLIVKGIRDYFYSDSIWVANIQSLVSDLIQEGDSVALLGNYKDNSSYYLKYFPQWDFVPAKASSFMSATDVRNTLFDIEVRTDWEGKLPNASVPSKLKKMVPEPVFLFLDSFIHTPEYAQMCYEYKHLKDYKKQWEKAPFPPTFVTVDTVVTCSGHVLVVKRKFSPGRGLYALPGGFIKENERIQDAALRELKEETGIRVDKLILESAIQESHVFDHPGRSLRGRTITHAFHIKLKDGKLPEVRGSDDAEAAYWIPIRDVYKKENQFFEDHSHIVAYFTSRS